MSFFIYDANYFMKFLKKKLLHKWLKELSIIERVCVVYWYSI
jgi:hypothetical protein